MSTRKPTGPAVAAFLSAMIGLLSLGIANLGDETTVLTNFLLQTGKLWVPNAQGIGPYSGKETFLLLGWLVSWVVLHLILRKRDIKLAIPVVIFIIGVAFATLTIYIPIINVLLGR
ncbi:MAG: hypothetical protein ABSF09_04710 [Candidatus Bathyarchaeia archaeon]|jgi:hypothetical protein